ncbi:hypothetical protein [Photobacterium swingsii]|uniref:Uncharacterized protein n=1 Tax=Photobacterium swingsii TaxID=680026 RepID=A0A0J8VAF6_9GAMM|nr:hypothetical protein [Photobacterium swingsii]KMV30428.1 hypothetical protein AB733_12275 [Photobacterium swingsii]PSW24389.1 hypothetical protein C9I94_10110 [Photobacterium swingsii]
MVSDLLTVSIQQFQADCQQLCEQHYPTVHNRGMRENHLGKALCRRIMTTLLQSDIHADLSQIEDTNNLPQPIFKLQTQSFTIWIVAHRLLSANLARRQALLTAVDSVLTQQNPEQENHLLVVADHWFDRSKASKEIPAWWLGQLPVEIDNYVKDGIRLLSSSTSLKNTLQDSYAIDDAHLQIHHPLHRTSDHAILHKYIVLTGHFRINAA